MTISTLSAAITKDDLARKAKPNDAKVNAPKPRHPNKSNQDMASTKKTKEQHWNSMSHLVLKRFRDDDPTLTDGARRGRIKHPLVAKAELDPSGRAVCKLCGERIAKGTLRLCLFLECHKGYRNQCTLHANECFWRHPETKKLENIDEIVIAKELGEDHVKGLKQRYAFFHKELVNAKVG